MSPRRILALLTSLTLSAPAFAQGVSLPDGSAILPPPPPLASAAHQEDIDLFNHTRLLKGTPRWDLATNDVNLHPDHLLADFSCAAGMKLDASQLPALVTLYKTFGKPLEAAIELEKEHWNRPRPFVGNDAPICSENLRDRTAKSASYPSGHTTLGWLTALMLAELMPDHASTILERGRVFGESRIVCGVHWKSDVQAGYINGGAMFAALLADKDFQTDLANAREELTTARARAVTPDAATCAVEHAAATTPLE